MNTNWHASVFKTKNISSISIGSDSVITDKIAVTEVSSLIYSFFGFKTVTDIKATIACYFLFPDYR